MRCGAGSLQPTSQPTCSASPCPPTPAPCATWGKMAKRSILLGNMVSVGADGVRGTELCASALQHKAALAVPVSAHAQCTRSHAHTQVCCACTKALALRCTGGNAYGCASAQIYGMQHNHPWVRSVQIHPCMCTSIHAHSGAHACVSQHTYGAQHSCLLCV